MMSPWLDSLERRGCTFGSSQGGCCAVRATAVGCARVRNVHIVLTNRPLPPMPIALFWKTTASSDPCRPSRPGTASAWRLRHRDRFPPDALASHVRAPHRTRAGARRARAGGRAATSPCRVDAPSSSARSTAAAETPGRRYTNDFIELFNRGSSRRRREHLVGAVRLGSGHELAAHEPDRQHPAGRLLPRPGGRRVRAERRRSRRPTRREPSRCAATAGKVALRQQPDDPHGLWRAAHVLPAERRDRRLRRLRQYGDRLRRDRSDPGTSNTASAQRTNRCVDTDNNAADFAIARSESRETARRWLPAAARPIRPEAGAADPTSALPGATTRLTVTVTPGANPTSTGLAVVGDLTPIGGSATQAFFDDGRPAATRPRATTSSRGRATVAAGTTPGRQDPGRVDHRRRQARTRIGRRSTSSSRADRARSRRSREPSHLSLVRRPGWCSSVEGVVTAIRPERVAASG